MWQPAIQRRHAARKVKVSVSIWPGCDRHGVGILVRWRAGRHLLLVVLLHGLVAQIELVLLLAGVGDGEGDRHVGRDAHLGRLRLDQQLVAQRDRDLLAEGGRSSRGSAARDQGQAQRAREQGERYLSRSAAPWSAAWAAASRATGTRNGEQLT